MDWQPIETAPKDGRDVLGFWPDRAEGHMAVAHYDQDRDRFRSDTVEWRNPTHWMPLPAPPSDCLRKARHADTRHLR
jgi:hypothetical protein